MDIVIKSEMDSRLTLYPLLRCLYSYGTILVVSNNRVLLRLIEEGSMGFRNVTVIVGNSDSADEICEENNVDRREFDFIIFDNLGTSECDACIIAVGPIITEAYESEIELVLGDSSIPSTVLQFGKAVQKKKPKEEPKEKQEHDPADKFRERVASIDKKKDKTVSVPYPTFEAVEKFESEHVFAKVDSRFANAFYQLFGAKLGVTQSKFLKEVQTVDESVRGINTKQW